MPKDFLPIRHLLPCGALPRSLSIWPGPGALLYRWEVRGTNESGRDHVYAYAEHRTDAEQWMLHEEGRNAEAISAEVA
jgi:hypothetical protein